MSEPRLIRVLGFTDAERHALNAIFRLSVGGPMPFEAATSGAAAALLLVDGHSQEAREWADVGLPADIPVLWVGPDGPQGVTRHLSRPLAWPEVIAAMQAAFRSQTADFTSAPMPDEGPPTQPSGVPAEPQRALVVSTKAQRQLYWRAKLSLNGLSQVDVASELKEAQEACRVSVYPLVVVDLDDWARNEGFSLVRQLRETPSRVGRVLAVSNQTGLGVRTSAWFAGAAATVSSPPEPEGFQRFIRSLALN